ncbi:E3 SUMO-protein ligase PIAS1-like [Daktulosphaira vitifoliae]|uniref:E3 SUMO-protein ligase PIAS1-like n=1 Tax=Daktulosphaira vitifoliae TaxID=58002 RepID=UPI0021AA10F5|nr:E3 SUMO-protein ligase PIAS1-like [Daktulosphaira vitifoliae]
MAHSINPSLISDIEYIHQLVYELRLNELQIILESFKHNKTGSKQSLRKRVLNLLTGPNSKTRSLKQKILQIYDSRQPQHSSCTRQHQQLPQRLQQIQHQQNFLQGFFLQPSHPMPVPTTNELSSTTDTSFENLPFYQMMDTLLSPMHCQNTADKGNFTGLFYLADSVRHSIVKSWNIARQEYKIQIILRLAQIDRNENVTERLPYNINVSVNDRLCKLPTLNIPTKAGVTPWRCNVPIDITQQTDLRNCLQNTLRITWSDEPHEYIAGVFVAQRLMWNELLEDLKKKPVRDPEKTKENIKKSMENDQDMGVDSLIATVKDPLSKKKMELPARGVNCIHMQCFDAIQFLQMNEQKQTWSCPLCKKKVNFDDIEVDGFFLDIVQSPKIDDECDNIILQKDGTWIVKQPKEKSSAMESNHSNNIEVFTLSDSESDLEEEPKSKRSKYSPCTSNEPSIKSENIVDAEPNNLSKKHDIDEDLVLDLSVKSGSSPPSTSSDYQPIITLHDEPDKSLLEPSSLLNTFRYLPNITISESKNPDLMSDPGTNNHTEKENSRSVLCVITLD